MENWCLKYDEWYICDELLREALCATGNGYITTRGAGAEAQISESRYPGTYLAGGYNRLKTIIEGQTIENEDLVNWPNWLCLDLKIENGRWFNPQQFTLLSYEQFLNYYEGTLVRNIIFQDELGRQTKLESLRFVSMSDSHRAGIQWKITPLNWSGQITVRSMLDGSVKNLGVKRYEKLNHIHLNILEKGFLPEGCSYIYVMTNQSGLCMAQASKLEVFSDEKMLTPAFQKDDENKKVSLQFSYNIQKVETLKVVKKVTIYTSKDQAITHPLTEAIEQVMQKTSFAELLGRHSIKWKHLWDHCNIELKNMPRETNILRFHIFHILQTLSPHTADLDVGTPSRGWHGEAYRGHVFWDEIYILPFLTLLLPTVARSLILYRYRRLGEAKRLAQAQGFQGAMYPWQSGSNGREESQVLHLNPISGRWVEDATHKQRHVNAAIVYNIWQFYEATNDLEFLSYFGTEMCLEIAKFWVSIAEYSTTKERYEIKNVVGPDEFHTAFPGRKETGVDNNAYTNYMAAWCIHKALEILALQSDVRQKELMEIVALTNDDLQKWREVCSKMFIPFQANGIISQFEGYEQLEELDWEHYRSKYGNIQRLDRLLEAEGKDPNEFKINKQADVLMLFYLFSAEELQEFMGHLGYNFDPETIPQNIHYYLGQTTNGSSLSRVVHSWVLARSQRERSWNYFQHALESDISDIQGGTTHEGIHLGAMAGTVDLVIRCYTGMDMDDDVLWLNPTLPEELGELEFSIHYRGHWMRLVISHEHLHITIKQSWAHPGCLGFAGNVYQFTQGDEFHFDLKDLSQQKVS